MVKAYTNREIKFRGKLKTTGEWVYGDLVRLQDGENMITAIYYKGEVEQKSVGQYTGFTDKNGKEIYEGDILENYDQALVTFRDGTLVFLPGSKAQAEAVKEFAEKLKKQIANTMYCRDGYVDYDDTMDVIDELLKEFLEQ